MKDDRVYLAHIRECLDVIAQFTSSGRDEFFRDRRTQDAVIRNLQTLAESATRLSTQCTEKHPQIDWRSIAGFRNVLVHNYLGINVERVWQVIERDLPPLRAAIENLLA